MSKLTIPPWLPRPSILAPTTYPPTTPIALPHSIPDLVTLLTTMLRPKPSLYAFVAMTAFNPIFWNFVARNEFRNKTITKIVRSPLIGCYLLALTIFSISAFRDHLFLNAVKDQYALAILGHPAIQALAAALFLAGQVFVITSMWALGITGTYLGDYFGILMSHRITSFPFNVLSDPMYVGSFFSHLGTALWFQSPAGLVLAAWVWVVYSVALMFEGPFTDHIYSAQAKKTTASPTRATTSVPPTPSRRSGRLAAKVSSSDIDSDSPTLSSFPGSGSVSGASGLRKVGTPRRAGKGKGEEGRRVTRSRSKSMGRTSDWSGDE